MIRALRIGLLVAVIAAISVAAAMWASGYRVYVLHTGSMTPNIDSGSIVIDRPAGHLHVGQVITFDKVPGQYTTHRVAAITSNGIETRGDANPSNDFGYVTSAQVAGQVQWAVPYAGFVVEFFTHPAGIIGVMLLMMAVWLAWDLLIVDEQPTTVLLTDRSNADPAPGESTQELASV